MNRHTERDAGSESDRREAMHWLKEAEAQGSSDAAQALQGIADGKLAWGCPVNMVERQNG